MKIRACMRSGFCCKKAPCPYGKFNKERTACIHLGGDKPGEYFCKEYKAISQSPSAHIIPAFGQGCSSALNSDRILLVKRYGERWVETE